MKKLLLITIMAVSGNAFAQMAIPGEVFASNPARFNGRKVTIKNIEIVKNDPGQTSRTIGGPAIAAYGIPGASGMPSSPVSPCRAPRGFAQVSLFFKAMPEYKGCFFMAENMKEQMERECVHESTPAQVTFRGDSRTGYHVSFYRLGS